MNTMTPMASESPHNSDKLYYSDLNFRSITDSLDMPVMLIDSTCRIRYVNKSAIEGFLRRITGSFELGDDFLNLIPSGEREGFELDIKKALKQELVVSMISFPNDRGKDIWFRFSMNPVRDENGDINCISVMIRNISAAEKKDGPLVRSETRYKEILQEQTDLICRFYPNGVITFVNDAYCKYFGQGEKKLTGSNLFELIPIEEKRKALKKLNNLTPDAPFYHYDQRVIDANHIPRWLACTDRGIFDRKGNLKEIQMVGRDITEQKQLEQELQRSNQKLEAILKVVPDLMFLFDEHANILDCYASSPSQLLMPRETFIGRNAKDVFLHYVLDTVQANIDSCLETKELQVQEYKVEIRNREVWYESRYVPAGNNTVLSISRDITERKHIERELIKAKEKAEESDRLKTSFLANISHEIRTPMNAIVGFSGLLEESGLTNDQIKEYAAIVSSSSHQLLAIIDDVVDISKIESGQIAIKHENTELGSVLNQMKALYSNIASLSKLELRTFPDPAFPELFLMTDGDKLKQVLSNLISNAIKFSENSTVDFGYLIKGDIVEFFVKDYGIGIPSEYHDIIFERFRQVEPFEQKSHGGTGLGLAIAKSIVETMGGKIWLESQTGKGTQFYFTIPAVKTELSETDFSRSPESITKDCWIGKKILIAEDEDSNYSLMCDLLRTSGVSIVRARNGVEALSIVVSDEPDLILMDIKMPVMNGLAATRAIRKHHSDIPIVLLTAYPFTHTENKALQAGGNDYFTKPVDSEELLSILYKYFNE